MSIVTILATSKYISAMSDGRVTGDNGLINTEDYEKVIKINDNSFIAFTGRVELFELLYETCKYENFGCRYYYEGIAQYVYKKFLDLQLLTSEFKLVIAVGGKNKNDEIGCCYFSNIGHVFSHMKPVQSNEMNRLLLVNAEYGSEQFCESLLETIGFGTLEKAKCIQELIHNYEATYDKSVNSNKYWVAIEK